MSQSQQPPKLGKFLPKIPPNRRQEKDMPLTRNNFLRRPSKAKERKSQRHGVRNAIYSVGGDKYKGEWMDDKRHGMGQQVWKSGATYIGDWKLGKPDGYGTYKKGEQLYIGEWKDGKKHGHGKFAYNDLSFYHGEWREGHRFGWGEMHYENGDVYMGDWLMDNRHGEGIMRYVGGDWYEGEWLNDKKHGEGKMYFAKKDQLYYGTWVNGEAKCGNLSDYDQEDVKEEVLTDQELMLKETDEEENSTLQMPPSIKEEEQTDEQRLEPEKEDGEEAGSSSAVEMPTPMSDEAPEMPDDGAET